MMKKLTLLLFLLILFSNSSFCQGNVIPLWPNEIPNSRESDETEIIEKNEFTWIENVQVPTLEIFLPPKGIATGQAVVICPGGGYWGVAYDIEGTEIAKFLNTKGIAGFVLKYRMPGAGSVVVRNEAPLQDAKRAIRTVRANAGKWNLSEGKIGVMGFSAGGHLASTLGTRYNSGDHFEKDSTDSFSARPDFMVLVYPVITMKEPYTHQGSRNNLLGEDPDEEMIEYYSNETQITEDTPPTFLVHATDDDGVPVENSLMFFQALKENGVSAEMHIYPEGGHGFNLGIGRGHLEGWTDRLYDWLQYMNE